MAEIIKNLAKELCYTMGTLQRLADLAEDLQQEMHILSLKLEEEAAKEDA